MDQQHSRSMSISDEIVLAIRNYGPSVGIHMGESDQEGCLTIIEQVLTRASRMSGNIGELAKTALDAVEERERRYNTEWELENPDEFNELTRSARDKLKNLLEAVGYQI